VVETRDDGTLLRHQTGFLGKAERTRTYLDIAGSRRSTSTACPFLPSAIFFARSACVRQYTEPTTATLSIVPSFMESADASALDLDLSRRL
jgi:hypothetical protein